MWRRRANVRLFGGPKREADKVLPEHYFELYQLAVEMADRLSARRATANAYFATLLTSLAGVITFIQPFLGVDAADWMRLIAGSLGLLLSLTWWLSLRSYRYLNEAKFEVIQKMEKKLPAAVFTEEWNYLESRGKGWRDRYHLLSESERRVPLIYALFFFIVLSWPLLVLAWNCLGNRVP